MIVRPLDIHRRHTHPHICVHDHHQQLRHHLHLNMAYDHQHFICIHSFSSSTHALASLVVSCGYPLDLQSRSPLAS